MQPLPSVNDFVSSAAPEHVALDAYDLTVAVPPEHEAMMEDEPIGMHASRLGK